MSRKKWTAKKEIDESLLQFRVKRKWQIALRRYVLERQKCHFYAPYFSLDTDKFRNWIELQFDDTLDWNDFSSAWQFDHVVPVAFFDFNSEDDLRLCWNFTNILVAKTEKSGSGIAGFNVLAAKRYFEQLFQNTGYQLCAAMVEKINKLEESQLKHKEVIERFINQNKDYLVAVQNFTSYDFERLNTGTDLNVLLTEKEFLKKFSA